jgi:hypothetical protein
MESYRSGDNLLVWRGRLDCNDGGAGSIGISCMTLASTSPANPVGQANPQAGAGCLVAMGTSTNVGWHHFVMGLYNTESVLRKFMLTAVSVTSHKRASVLTYAVLCICSCFVSA